VDVFAVLRLDLSAISLLTDIILTEQSSSFMMDSNNNNNNNNNCDSGRLYISKQSWMFFAKPVRHFHVKRQCRVR